MASIFCDPHIAIIYKLNYLGKGGKGSLMSIALQMRLNDEIVKKQVRTEIYWVTQCSEKQTSVEGKHSSWAIKWVHLFFFWSVNYKNVLNWSNLLSRWKWTFNLHQLYGNGETWTWMMLTVPVVLRKLYQNFELRRSLYNRFEGIS